MIDKVTITGADDSTDIDWMNEMTEKYPFVEWGILVSKSSQGMHRYPTKEWMKDLDKKLTENANLSLHVCGRWVRRICSGDWDTMESELDGLIGRYKRIQLNFHAYSHALSKEFFEAALKKSTERSWQLIFQCDGVNDHLVSNAYDDGIDAVPLYDLSGGAGVVPENWPTQMKGIYSGYAGGLGPKNIVTELARIIQAADNDGKIWIDMETRVRKPDDSDLDKKAVEQS